MRIEKITDHSSGRVEIEHGPDSIPRQTPRHPHVETWGVFASGVFAHIQSCKQGHYVRDDSPMEPIDFFESYLDTDWLVGQVCKYTLRVKKTRNSKDLYKAAHYLSRIYQKLVDETPKM